MDDIDEEKKRGSDEGEGKGLVVVPEEDKAATEEGDVVPEDIKVETPKTPRERKHSKSKGSSGSPKAAGSTKPFKIVPGGLGHSARSPPKKEDPRSSPRGRGFTVIEEEQASFHPPSAVVPGESEDTKKPRHTRSGSATVIQRAFRKHVTRRQRAFTNTNMEEKEALRLSASFQAVQEIRSKALNWEDLTDIKQLTSGMFGDVHIARYRGYVVIVKTLKPMKPPPKEGGAKSLKKAQEEEQLAISDFKKEMSMLTKLWHRNIVHLIGVGVKPKLFMVMEFMEGGSLKEVMAETRRLKVPLDRGLVYDYSMDCAHGMRYLHEAFPRIIHRDLKPANLLISKAWGGEGIAAAAALAAAAAPAAAAAAAVGAVAPAATPLPSPSSPSSSRPSKKKDKDKEKPSSSSSSTTPSSSASGAPGRPELKIADFGLSRILGPNKKHATERYRLTGGTGSLRYMAPEVAANQPYNEKADVYGFGVILWEMLANDLPYKKLHTNNFYREVVKKKIRPPMDPLWPLEVVRLIEDCWAHDPDKRPTFRKIIQMLQNIKETTDFFNGERDKPISGCCSIL
jgi:serine/threonine protein kinase